MEWRDQGILLSSRRHGESGAIIEVFTPGRGRHLGVVRGGASRKTAPILQPGAQLDVTWRARLEEHLGAFTVEPLQSRAAGAMSDRLALAGLTEIRSSQTRDWGGATGFAAMLIALPFMRLQERLPSPSDAADRKTPAE